MSSALCLAVSSAVPPSPVSADSHPLFPLSAPVEITQSTESRGMRRSSSVAEPLMVVPWLSGSQVKYSWF
jgi:hypothetical protein